MVNCRNCGKKLPYRSLLFSPKLSVADVECPFCQIRMHAGRKSKHTIWLGLIGGGLVAATVAYVGHYSLGWSQASSIGIIFVISIMVSSILTVYAWFKNDFYMDN